MLITVAELRERSSRDLSDLVAQLQTITGRSGDEEAMAWRESLPKLADLLVAPSMQGMHLYCREGDLSLEYQIPASGAWADVVLLGAHQGSPAAVIVELKHWVTRADRRGRAEGLIERQGVQELHPSDQVRGYVNYCRHFHSAVQDAQASVHGCVLFTRDFVTQPYTESPNAELAANYPIFTLSQEDVSTRAPDYFGSRISEPNKEFARAFEAGHYRQQRGFVRQIAAQILSAKARPFELIDNQRRAFALCKAVTEEVVSKWRRGRVSRRVVIVKGPPGSGKSAVAARLWAEVSLMPEVPDGDIVFVTTSMSQNTNWTHLFADAGPEGARGVVRKASSFHPISTHRVGRLRQMHGAEFLAGVQAWKTHLGQLCAMGEPFQDGAQDQQQLVSIVDEAHSLINTDREGGIGQFGFAPTLGPQAYHIIRASTLSIFFLDPEQGFRHRENTAIDDLRSWARELGAGDVIEVDLEGVQFRCAGSNEYVDWVESVLDGASIERSRVLAAAWYIPPVVYEAGAQVHVVGETAPARRAAQPNIVTSTIGNVVALRKNSKRQPFDFRIFDDPISMEEALRAEINHGGTARLLSTYSRPWKTSGQPNPHGLPPSLQDFHEIVLRSGAESIWSRPWNVVPARTNDYSHFVQGSPGSRIADDPLCEIGCPYAVRGFDYDYIGVLWMEDLLWRGDRWVLDLDHVHETGITQLVNRARRERVAGAAAEALRRKVAQAYRIVLTRALRGLFVWVKDKETRDHLAQSLGS
jgi:DUF2075 family protein